MRKLDPEICEVKGMIVTVRIFKNYKLVKNSFSP